MTLFFYGSFQCNENANIEVLTRVCRSVFEILCEPVQFS